MRVAIPTYCSRCLPSQIPVIWGVCFANAIVSLVTQSRWRVFPRCAWEASATASLSCRHSSSGEASLLSCKPLKRFRRSSQTCSSATVFNCLTTLAFNYFLLTAFKPPDSNVKQCMLEGFMLCNRLKTTILRLPGFGQTVQVDAYGGYNDFNQRPGDVLNANLCIFWQ